MKIYGVLILLVSTATIGNAMAATGSSVTFAKQGPYSGGAAVVVPPNAGIYVYSVDGIDDGRRTQRFILGKVPRQNFVLFSAQEEDALFRVRAAKLAEIEAARRKSVVRRASSHKNVQLNWPKVIVVGDRTCVPTPNFANSLDWKEHLVCWNEGAERVE
ncbi:hypothetical protein [Pandoraea commovens]|uniref:Uncharacterized protein n=1 Tax=Pandoraea commovens TaxID=2508289 RepID=A0ABY5Q9I9_9BURK|nr:hypothetical protein [Pandoraea commovens]UVA77160.1 hypothetical protein NTU39_00050 [Pandoraea commovens]